MLFGDCWTSSESASEKVLADLLERRLAECTLPIVAVSCRLTGSRLRRARDRGAMRVARMG